jgi:small subunit ribosomal protein S20
MNKTRLKNATKAVRQSVAEKSPESARTQLREAESVIAKASKKGTIHKRTAARKISRLARLVNSLQSQ